MHETVLKSGWDTLIFAVPFVGFLFVGLFRLDELFAAPKHEVGRKPQRPAAGVDADGEPIFCDPDGRPWRKARRSK